MNFSKIVRSPVLFHFLFWISLILSFGVDIIEYSPVDKLAYFASISIRLVLIAALIYLNLLVLIPKLLKKKHYVLYGLAIVLLLFLFSISYRTVYLQSTDQVYEITRKYRLLTNIFLGFRFLLISLFLNYLKELFLKEKELNQVKIDKLSAELNYLRAQINPHFMFNTLNNLYGLTLIKSDKAPEIVLKLSEIMEYMLYGSNDDKVSLRKELANITNYIELEKIRQGNQASISFTIRGNTENLQITPLLLLPIIENGFKHGVYKISKNSYLKIEIIICNQMIECTVLNNKNDKLIQGHANHGIGLINLKKRLDNFYFNCYEFRVSENEAEYGAYLKLILS